MDWETAIAHIVKTPQEYFCSVDEGRAREILGCSDEEFQALGRAYGDETLRFDVFDIWNIGLHSQSGRSQPEREILYLSHLFGRDDVLEPARHRLSIEASCPRGVDCTNTSWDRPEIPDAAWAGTTFESGTIRWAADVTRQGTNGHIVSPAIAEVWTTLLAQYRFHYTHPAIATSASVTRERRVGNCSGLSALLAEDLTREGIPARLRSGFLWGGLVGLAHEWVDVLDADGTWKSLDPSMAVLADAFYTPRYKRLCFGSLLTRVIPVDHGGTTTVRHVCAADTFTLYPTVRRWSARPRPNSATLIRTR